jgi:hypothetical protein
MQPGRSIPKDKWPHLRVVNGTKASIHSTITRPNVTDRAPTVHKYEGVSK